MKVVLLISLLILFLCSCSNSNCDCSYEAFNKIKEGMKVSQVNRSLKATPFKSTEIGQYKYIGYKCNENVITICVSKNKWDGSNIVYVIEKSFNAPLYNDGTKIDFK